MSREQIDKLIAEPHDEIKRLEKLVDQHAATVERLRKAQRSKVPKAKLRTGAKSFIRVVYGDTHGAYLDQKAFAAFLGDLDILQPKSLVHVGDALDCNGFLCEHNTTGVVAELDYSFEDDAAQANMVFDETQARAGKGADYTFIDGNHDHRIDRWICKQVLGNAKSAHFLRKLFSPAEVLNLKDRGIRHIQRNQYYDSLLVSGTVKLHPHAVAQHGEKHCGKYAMFAYLMSLGHTVLFGHTHRLGAVYSEKLDGHIVAVNTGCLCSIRPLYGMTKTTDWTHGYVIQVCSSDGFLAIPVPILNGVSYLEPLARMLKL